MDDNCSDNNVECSELNQQECIFSEECEWTFIATPNGYYETCINVDDWGGEEEGCFEPGVGPDHGEWFDFGQELFIPYSKSKDIIGYKGECYKICKCSY